MVANACFIFSWLTLAAIYVFDICLVYSRSGGVNWGKMNRTNYVPFLSCISKHQKSPTIVGNLICLLAFGNVGSWTVLQIAEWLVPPTAPVIFSGSLQTPCTLIVIVIIIITSFPLFLFRCQIVMWFFFFFFHFISYKVMFTILLNFERWWRS